MTAGPLSCQRTENSVAYRRCFPESKKVVPASVSEDGLSATYLDSIHLYAVLGLLKAVAYRYVGPSPPRELKRVSGRMDRKERLKNI